MAVALARTSIIAVCAALLAFAPARAQQVVTVTTTVSWIYEEGGDEDGFLLDETDALPGDEALAADADPGATRRYAPSPTLATLGQAKARFGPFAVIDARTVRMAGDVTAATPRQFAAMMAAFPGLRRIDRKSTRLNSSH